MGLSLLPPPNLPLKGEEILGLREVLVLNCNKPPMRRFFPVLLLLMTLTATSVAIAQSELPPEPETEILPPTVVETLGEHDSPPDNKLECTLPKPLCGDKPDFAAYWQSMERSDRLSLLKGFDIGLQAAWQASYLEGGEAGSIRGSIFDRRLNQNEIYAGVGLDFFLDYFNKFYADAPNANIDWGYAWLLASLAYQQANNPDQGVQDELFLKKFLQTYGELPGWVRIVDVLAPDKIEIEVLVPEPYRLAVKLRGVSVQNADGEAMTPEAQSRAMDFIRGLAATRGYPFDDCGCTEMVRPQLFYGGSLFTKDGTMQAYVRISEGHICLLKSEVSARELNPGSTDQAMTLNEALLINGLAYVDEQSSDYLESDRLLQNVDAARARGLNVYGSKRSPVIERVIKQGPKPINQNCLP